MLEVIFGFVVFPETLILSPTTTQLSGRKTRKPSKRNEKAVSSKKEKIIKYNNFCDDEKDAMCLPLKITP